VQESQQKDLKLRGAEQEWPQLVNDVLKQAKKLGASSAAVGLSIGTSTEVSVRMEKVEHVEQSCGRSLGIKVYFGQRVGSASTSDFSTEAIRLTIEKACYIARYTNDDPCAGLADAELMARNLPPLDLYHPWSISTVAAIKLARRYEAAGLACDRRIINSDGATVGTGESFGIYANTHGFVGSRLATLHSVSCSFIAAEKNKRIKLKAKSKSGAAAIYRKMQRDGDYTTARVAKLLAPVKVLGESAAKFALRRLGARHLKTRECPVIFEAPVAKTVIGSLLSAVSGSNLYNKTSFLCDYLGKQVLAKHLSIDEQPHLLQGLGSAAFDADGVQTKQQLIVADGMLDRYILGSYSARKLKMKTTGNAGGCYNIFVKTSSNEMDFKALLKAMGTGLVVIELLGSGINITTGDFSCGAFGLWVERGEIKYPVDGITIAGNLKEMLLNIVAMSNDIDCRGTLFTGSLLVPRIQVGGM